VRGGEPTASGVSFRWGAARTYIRHAQRIRIRIYTRHAYNARAIMYGSNGGSALKELPRARAASGESPARVYSVTAAQWVLVIATVPARERAGGEQNARRRKK